MARILVLILLSVLVACEAPRYGYLEFDAINTSLMRALDDGDLAAADHAVRAGANLNYQGREGMTPAIWYLRLNHNVSGPVLGYILQQGGDPNQQSDAGYSMVYFAAQRANVELLEVVLDAGGDPNLPNPADHFDGFPIFNVISSSNADNLPALLTLIDHGADLRARSGTRNTPLMTAIVLAQYDLALAILVADPLTKCDVVVNEIHTVTVDGLIETRFLSAESEQVTFRERVVELISEVECQE